MDASGGPYAQEVRHGAGRLRAAHGAERAVSAHVYSLLVPLCRQGQNPPFQRRAQALDALREGHRGLAPRRPECVSERGRRRSGGAEHVQHGRVSHVREHHHGTQSPQRLRGLDQDALVQRPQDEVGPAALFAFGFEVVYKSRQDRRRLLRGRLPRAPAFMFLQLGPQRRLRHELRLALAQVRLAEAVWARPHKSRLEQRIVCRRPAPRRLEWRHA
mmetsp:Transcript_15421/g.51986  ORF Transcript_15421/g.51986 Transcript_15421/m.51986 type:complete len:216 (-) Transcript_15421:151-798(-)